MRIALHAKAIGDPRSFDLFDSTRSGMMVP